MESVLLFVLAQPALALPGSEATWETLLKNPVHVECTEVSGEPFCRSTAVFEAEPQALRDTLGSMADHVDEFESILEVQKLGDGDIMHVVMDFPWPLADRDYVAKYTQKDLENGGMVLEWTAASHPEAPATDDRVRLDNFQGSWTLTPKDGTTEVVYLWHALYGGSLPNQALNTARKKTGQEALKDLASAAGGLKYSSPLK